MTKNDKKQDMAARAAWMYYIGGQTQNQIADILGVSRQVAQRLVAAASEMELVQVRISHTVAQCASLAEQMKQAFGLTRCQVVPSAGLPAETVQHMITVSAAEEIEWAVQPEQPQIIALGSGRTLRGAVKEMSEISRPQHSCLSRIGAIASDGSCTLYDVSLSLAEKTSGKYFILPAPLFADNQEDREVWCNHRIYKLINEQTALADVTFIGIGPISFQCPLYTGGFITAEDVQRLMDAGAVAEINGHFIDNLGDRLPDMLDSRCTSIPLQRSPARQLTAFAGGEDKYQAVQAVLKGKWINGLVTDESTAERLLLENS